MQLNGKTLDWQRVGDKLRESINIFGGSLLFFSLLLWEHFILTTLMFRFSFRIKNNNGFKVIVMRFFVG